MSIQARVFMAAVIIVALFGLLMLQTFRCIRIEATRSMLLQKVNTRCNAVHDQLETIARGTGVAGADAYMFARIEQDLPLCANGVQPKQPDAIGWLHVIPVRDIEDTSLAEKP